MTREEEIAAAFYDYRNVLKLSTFGDFEYINIQEAFEEGAKWSDNHPKSPWISVKDDLPCNHAEMLHPMCNIKTQYVITSIGGLCYINNMLKYRDKWIWEMDKPTHWMPIPKLPKELDYVRD